MDAHFWPSVYPAIIVGLLVGLGQGGFKNLLLGGIAGLVGGSGTLLALKAVGLNAGLLGSVITLAGGGLAALALTKALAGRNKDDTRSD
jgi:hypothetical protein